MKKQISKYKSVFCIQDYQISGCSFVKNKTYRMSCRTFNTQININCENREPHTINNLTIHDNNSKLNFDEFSPFAVNDFPKYFSFLKEERKQKLEKLNLI